jgi:hypothetical protein
MRKIIVACALALISAGVFAQNFQSGYFLEGYHLAYRQNPAFTDTTDFRTGLLSIASANWRSNIGLSHIFYPYHDYLVTAFNKGIPASEVMNKFPAKGARIDVTLDLGIFATGFKRGNIYHTVDVTLKYAGQARVPYDYVSLLKEGVKAKEFFNLSGLDAGLDNYLELSYGQTRNWGKLKYGVRVKPLIGLGHGRFRARDITIDTSGYGWVQDVQADVEFAGGLVTYDVKEKDGVRKVDLGSIGFNRYKIKFGGLGVALDLGAEYPLTDNLILSASILDLGGIKWFDKVYGKSDAVYTYDPNREDIDPEDDFQPIREIADAFDFQVQDKKLNSFEKLPMSFNLGAKYKMPFNKNISAALLYTYRPYRFYGYNEVRLFGCWNPLKWLSLDLSGAKHNFGWSLGGAFDVHAKGFNIFWGIDTYAFKVTPQMIPINKSNIGMSFGVSFPLYRRSNG